MEIAVIFDNAGPANTRPTDTMETVDGPFFEPMGLVYIELGSCTSLTQYQGKPRITRKVE